MNRDDYIFLGLLSIIAVLTAYGMWDMPKSDYPVVVMLYGIIVSGWLAIAYLKKPKEVQK